MHGLIDIVWSLERVLMLLLYTSISRSYADHGAANNMFVVGNQVKGGHYGELPSLTKLNPEDNLAYTTDFRRVYQTVIEGWLGHRGSGELLGGNYQPFDMFA